MRRVNKKLWLLFGLTALVGLAILNREVIQWQRECQSVSLTLLGNGPSTLTALKEEGLPFSFLVMGDPSTNAVAEGLIKKASEQGRASFLILLGDLVRRPDLWDHRFFITQMATAIHSPLPVFLVSGNHDIDWKSSIRPLERRVTPKVYESLYGSRNFNFIFNNCLFILCGVDARTPTAYLEYLHKILFEKAEGRRHVFVFLHFYPDGLIEGEKGSLPAGDRFLSLLEEFGVTASFFGDFHGWRRDRRNGVDLIVSGGGGRLKKSRTEWGRFNHMLRVTVHDQGISEEIMTARDRLGWRIPFKKWVFTNLFPMLQAVSWVLYLSFGLLLGASLFSAFLFWNAVRRV